LGQEKVLKTLEGLGITQPDAHIYILLGKKGPQKAVDIAIHLKLSKQTAYRAIKNLQSKGLITATIEHPARFSAVPFEKVLDMFVKEKMEEVHRIKQDKKTLLNDWQSIAISEAGDRSPRFAVIEGRRYIYPRLKQMIEDAESELSIVSTGQGIVRADQFGLLDAAFEHSLKTNTKARLITEVSKENRPAIKTLLKKTHKKSGFEGRTPELGLGSMSRMIIRDDAEVLFFVNQISDQPGISSEDLALWTNSKAIVNSFKVVFEGLWQNSTDIQSKITELETGRSLPKTHVFASADEAFKKYNESIWSALKEVTILTSSQTLLDISKQGKLLDDWKTKQVAVRIMAPITRSTISAVKQLLKFCQVKHVPVGCKGTTIVDNKEMFQFDHASYETEHQSSQHFENAFYSNNLEYVEKTSKMLDDMWRSTQDPQEIISGFPNESTYNPEILSENNPYMKLIGIKVVDIKPLTERKILSEIIEARRLHVENPERDAHKIYATGGSAIIHPPSHLNLPDLMIEMAQVESQSSLGPANVLLVYQWLNTSKGVGYALVAMVYTTPKPWAAAKQLYKDTLAADNIQLVKEDELQIRVHGNIMFAGWTIPIPLFPRNIILPPACLTLEGYGKVHPTGHTLVTSDGTKSIIEQNCFDAFVTFMHPHSKYSGAGTDGFFARDYILTLQPPT